MSFRTTIRVSAPVAGVSLLLLIVGISGAWYVQRLQRQTSEILNRNVASIRAAEELEVYLLQIRFELNQFLITGDRAELAQAIAMHGRVEEWLARARQVATSTEEEQSLNAIRDGLTRLFSELNRLSETSDTIAARDGVEVLVDEVLSEQVLPASAVFLDFNEQEVEQSSRANQELADRLVLALLLLGTCGAIAGLVAGYGVARTISRSILQLSLPVKDVAGQLSEVVGPVTMSADPGLEDLESVLNKVSTEVAAVIQQLHDRHREVLRADQLAALGQLAAGLAHELRNPLMCMTVLVQSALSDPTRTLDDRDLQVLNDEMRRLDRLLQEFLDFARPADVQLCEIDLRQPVQQTVEFLSARARQVQVRIDADLPEHPVTIRADDNQLRQLILNLLLNSIDAASPDGCVAVSVSRDEATTGSCLLVIRDDGHGLSQENLERIFEPFFSTKEGGLGMGLTACRRIVEAHGGEISVANRATGGAAFTVRFPAVATFPERKERAQPAFAQAVGKTE